MESYKAKIGAWPENINVRTAAHPFEKAAERMLGWLERHQQPLPPTFAFIDPFGPKGLPMRVIARLLDADKCEVCVHFMLGSVTRWIRVGEPNPHVSELFGTTECHQAVQMRGVERQRFLLDLYKRQLRTIGGFRYVSSFSLFDLRNRWISAIVYGTNNVSGMKVMKRAMWKVDPVHGGMFSDRAHASGQLSLFQTGGLGYIHGLLGPHLLQRFRGQRVAVERVEEFVVTDTDFGPQHWKGALAEMERAKRLRVTSPSSRRVGTFPARTVVEFHDGDDDRTG